MFAPNVDCKLASNSNSFTLHRYLVQLQSLSQSLNLLLATGSTILPSVKVNYFFLFLIGAYPFVSLGFESKDQPENNAVASSSRSTPIDPINDTTNLSASSGFIFPNAPSQQQQQQSRTRILIQAPEIPIPFSASSGLEKWKWGRGSMIIRDNSLQAVTFGGTPWWIGEFEVFFIP